MIKNIIKSRYLKTVPTLLFGGWVLFALFFSIEAKGLRDSFQEEIDMAAKQRMFTQKILLESHKIYMHDNSSSKNTLLRIYTQMRENIYFLHEKYFRHDEKLIGIKSEVEKLLSSVEQFMESSNRENFDALQTSAEITFERVSEVVDIVKENFAARQKRLIILNLFFLLSSIGMTFLFVRYMFFPAAKLAADSQDELMMLNKELELKVEERTLSLQRSHNYIDSLLQASDEAQIVVNNAFRVIDLNSNAKNIFANISKGIELSKLLEDVKQKKEIFTFISFLSDYDANLKSDKVFFYNRKYYKMRYKMLNLSTFIITLYDITHEIQELKRRDAIYNSQQSIVVVTNGKNIKNINTIFFSEFGFANLEDFKSKHSCICELFRQKNGCEYLAREMEGMTWNNYMRQKSKESYQVLMINKDGIEKIYNVKSSGNLFSEDDYEDEEVIVFNDITELEEKNRILVMQSKDAAIGEMMSMIAHQWRQPLSVQSTILSRIRVMREMDMLDDTSFDSALDKLNMQISYMSKTIDDFREFFKDSDYLESIEVQDIVYSAKNLVEVILNSKNISFEVDFRVDREMKVETMLSKISQVFLNIYKNAIDQIGSKNIEDGQIRVNVYTQEDELIIEVCDNALGVDESIIDKIFEPYYSTKSKNGTGLGLYMSKKIVQESLGGKLSVKNVDKGACFIISLKI